ncbi:radical SAM protein [Rhizobium sp. NPDC090279]|uniref:radical SAM protein n=1 Tax=Rhizobium sp. NPDC090279 TaxID=3364499 RepID=UPI00383B4071
MSTKDCLLIGHNEMSFKDYHGILENMSASSGRDHVAFRDLQFNCVEYGGVHHQGQDLLTTLYNEDRQPEDHRVFYNGDCFWTALAYLGTFLHKRGYSFDYINLFQFEKEKLRTLLQNSDYHAVVLTGTMYVFEQNIWEVVRFIRSVRKDVKIIAGGPYISKQAEEREPEYLKPLFKYLDADFYCYGREGEQTLLKLLDTLRSGGPFEAIPNLAFRDGRSFSITPKLFEHTPLSENIIDYELFREDYAKSGWANIRISDGCPYACGFCSFPEHGNERYVTLSLDRIEQELDTIKAAGAITHIFFVDATFNVPKKKFKDLMRLMIRKQYGFKWHCFFRCDQADEEAIGLMKEAGCIGVFLGLESASESVLRNMAKTAHKEDFRRTMPIFKRLGIRQMVSVQVGYPGETYETFIETLDFLEEIRPDFTRIQIWFCDVTTPVWYKRNTFGLHGKGYGWRHFTMDAETAVGLVEDSFMRLENVTWIPDPGFNWVFCYMLEKSGMPIERQKHFLECFAAAAKERLVLPGRKAVNKELVDELRQLAHFDRPTPARGGVTEAFSGRQYRASESFWVDLIPKMEDAPSVAPVGTAQRFLMNASTQPQAIRLPDSLKDLPQEHQETLLEAQLLAAIGKLKVSGGLVALSPDDGIPFPVPGSEVDNAGARIRYVEQKRMMMMRHRLFGFFVLLSRQRMHFWKRPRMQQRTALVSALKSHGHEGVEQRFQQLPYVLDELETAFTLLRTGDEYSLAACYDPSAISANEAKARLSQVIRTVETEFHDHTLDMAG